MYRITLWRAFHEINIKIIEKKNKIIHYPNHVCQKILDIYCGQIE